MDWRIVVASAAVGAAAGVAFCESSDVCIERRAKLFCIFRRRRLHPRESSSNSERDVVRVNDDENANAPVEGRHDDGGDDGLHRHYYRHHFQPFLPHWSFVVVVAPAVVLVPLLLLPPL